MEADLLVMKAGLTHARLAPSCPGGVSSESSRPDVAKETATPGGLDEPSFCFTASEHQWAEEMNLQDWALVFHTLTSTAFPVLPSHHEASASPAW